VLGCDETFSACCIFFASYLAFALRDLLLHPLALWLGAREYTVGGHQLGGRRGLDWRRGCVGRRAPAHAARQVIMMKRFAALATLLWAGAASATPPQRHALTYEGRQSAVTVAGRAALPLPPSDQLTAMRKRNHCSAAGGPAARWAIIDSTLYLTHFSDCGANVPLGAVYEGVTSPLVATWISGELRASRGAVICFTAETGAVAETTLAFTVERGIVTDVEESDNSGACPER